MLSALLRSAFMKPKAEVGDLRLPPPVAALYAWFETRIDAFERGPIERPPQTLLAFFLHYLRPVWPVFVFLTGLGALSARVGGAPVAKAAGRVAFWGALAMGLTFGVGRLFGTMV